MKSYSPDSTMRPTLLTRRKRAAAVAALTAIVLVASARPALAQLRAEAIAGEPFGVGRIDLEVPRGLEPDPLGVAGVGVSDKDGRVLYPTVARLPVRRLLRELLDAPQLVRVYFLFQGQAPLQLTLQLRTAQTIALPVAGDPARHAAFMDAWWREYNGRPGPIERNIDYPPLVDNYLSAMLAYRLGRPLPARELGVTWQQAIARGLGASLADESSRLAMVRDGFLRPAGAAERADQPLPAPAAQPPLALPEPPAGVEIEPLAMRTPAECLYLRFGSFSNFLWFQDTLTRWNGDLRNLLAQRGLDHQVRQRLETRLVLRQTELARLLGDRVVADVAIVGTDLAFNDGAAYGILFHARKNNPLFAADVLRQRRERLDQGGVTEETVQLDGHDVSYLSSPDGGVRSYYAADGDFHFVTTSRTLARRFLETGSGKGALGATKEFRHARSILPVGRGDTAFVYLSDAFFRNLISPGYWIETSRRTRALADLEMVELARLASATEGRPGGSIEELVAGRFLPAGFGPLADGSRAVIADGEAIDSLRGHRGCFTPVPDVEASAASAGEIADYRGFVEAYQSQWGRLDPVMAGLRRTPEDGGRERIEIDARMTPLDAKNLAVLRQWFGPADKTRLAPIAGDSAAFEAILAQERLFGGFQGFGPYPPPEGRALPVLGLLDTLSLGYLGTTGAGGLLTQWDRRFVPPEVGGISVGPLGVWRYRNGPMTIFSLRRDLLEHVLSRIRWQQGDDEAQVRVNVGDISQGRLAPWLNDLAYARTRLTSLGNLMLLHQLQQQLHVPGEHAKPAAELILGAHVVCPLGGQYVYHAAPDGTGFWTSTAMLPGQRVGLLQISAPDGYRAPPLNWFRGLKLTGLVASDTVVAHAEVQMEPPPEDRPPANPPPHPNVPEAIPPGKPVGSH